MKPYPDQIAALSAALKHERGIISMPTGSGKSQVIRLIIERLNLRALVIVPTLEIKHQMALTLKDCNAKVMNIDASELEHETNYHVLIIDECHHAAARTYQKLNKRSWNNIYHRFMLTATPFRNDDEETLLFESICGQVIYQLTYADAVARGYIVPVEAYVIECKKQPTDAFLYKEVYNQLIVHNEHRNLLIGVLLARLKDVPTLCLVKEIAHGEILSRMTGIPFVSGQDEESRDYITLFNRGEITSLIGTTGVLGEGIDSRPAQYIIIAGLGKAKSNLMQQIGRGVRTYKDKESCKVIIFKDKSHKYLLRHFNIQAKLLKDEYNAIISRIEL